MIYGKTPPPMSLIIRAYNVYVSSEGDQLTLTTRTQEDVNRIDNLAERIGMSQSLKNAFDPILSAILTALDAAAVFVRTKALRSLGQILLVDASILSNVSLHALTIERTETLFQIAESPSCNRNSPTG